MDNLEVLDYRAIHLSPTGIRDLNEYLKHWAIDSTVVIERQQGFEGGKGKGSCRTNFGVGRNYGAILTLLDLNKLKYVEVEPRVWIKGVPPIDTQPLLSLMRDKDPLRAKPNKLVTLSWVRHLYPSVQLQTPVGVWLDGIADAIMLSRYYAKTHVNPTAIR
jgi:hypothetical protein